jgi:hypothetical protein
MRWKFMRSWLVTIPDHIDAIDDADLERQLQQIANAKSRPPKIGQLTFDWATDQVDAYFERNGKRLLFATMMPEK